MSSSAQPPEPVAWPAHEWLRLFFGDADAKPDDIRRFHQILQGDSQLAAQEFSAFVAMNRQRLGDLWIELEGRLVCGLSWLDFKDSNATAQSQAFAIDVETAGALIELRLRQGSNPRIARQPSPTSPADQDSIGMTAMQTSGALVSVGPTAPQFIGQYAIQRLIGRGGMGAVYLAEHPVLHRPVAVKVLPGARFNDPDAVSRLMREARLGAGLRHPGICQILDAGQSEGDFFFAMEYLEGPDLQTVIDSRGPLPVGLACSYALQLFEVLSLLAQSGIVHRDIKPSNLMLNAEGRLKLVDLGLAKDLNRQDSDVVTHVGHIMGTPAFMAPEQVRDASRVGPAADLYAGGVTLFQMLTGRLPFRGRGTADYLTQILHDQAPDPREFRADVPAELAVLTFRLLAKSPSDRPDHQEVLAELAIFQDPDAALPPPRDASEPVVELGSDSRIGDSAVADRPSRTIRDDGPGPLDSSSIELSLPVSTIKPRPALGRRSWLSEVVRFPVWVLSAAWRGLVELLRPRAHPVEVEPSDAELSIDVYQTPWPAPPPAPPAPVSLARPRGGTEILTTGGRLAVLNRLADAQAQFKDPNASELVDWLPKVEERPQVGQYLLDKRLGVTKTAVHTYRAHGAESGHVCIIRLLPLALGQLAPEKLRQLRAKLGELISISSQSAHLTRLLTVEKTELNRGNFKTLYYTVEDFVQGTSIEDTISEGRPLDVGDARDFLQQSLDGLRALHDHPLLHGNLHPGKIFLDWKARHVRISDLSHVCEFHPPKKAGADPLTCAIHGVDVLGDHSAKRRRYLAPEVLYGFSALGPAAEQFALGIIFLEALRGDFTSGAEGIDRHDYERQVKLLAFQKDVASRSRRFAQVLTRMTHVDPGQRYPTLRDAVADVMRIPRPRKARVGSAKPPKDHKSIDPTPQEESPPMPIPPLTPEPSREIGFQERERLVDILAEQAAAFPDGAQIFLEDLVAKANLPRKWRTDLSVSLRLAPNAAARRLVDWAIVKKEHPESPQLTVLGGLLKALLPELGFSEARFVVALVCHYRLYQDPELLRRLEQRYQVPQPAELVGHDTLNLGPDITWNGPPDETVTLQSWLPPASALLDVGYLQRALEQTVAICRIEIPGRDRRGTGFLVAPRQVLTCYHVLDNGREDDLMKNARAARLRFGAFSNPTGSEASGQVFPLDPDPVVKASPANKLDYLLLRVAEPIAQGRDLRPVRAAASAPGIRNALNILQHPEGDSMKISLCASGVTAVDTANGKLQYVTLAKGGSSGSPCFNENWEVVAMHHAQRARAFSTIREGILFEKIFEEIRALL